MGLCTGYGDEEHGESHVELVYLLLDHIIRWGKMRSDETIGIKILQS